MIILNFKCEYFFDHFISKLKRDKKSAKRSARKFLIDNQIKATFKMFGLFNTIKMWPSAKELLH